MQRITKRIRKKKSASPLLAFIPYFLITLVIQAFINIFTSIQIPILWVEFILFLYFTFLLVHEFAGHFPISLIANFSDKATLFTWFLLGKNYEVINIENGEMTSSSPQLTSRKLVLIDPASALAVRHPDGSTTFHDAGLFCLQKEPTIHGIFDLRMKIVSIPEIPDAIPGHTEQENPQSPAISALTRDGYQIGASFWVHYKYDIPFGKNGNPYGFDAAVLATILKGCSFHSGAIANPDEYENHLLLNTLQALWREYISQYDLLELIPSQTGSQSLFGVIEEGIQNMLLRRSEKHSATMDDFSSSAQLVRSGIRVLQIYLQGISIPEETDIAIQHHWQPGAKVLLNELQGHQQQEVEIFQKLGEMHALHTFLQHPWNEGNDVN